MPTRFAKLLSVLESPFRVMVLLDVTAGLRRSELFALKWSDIDLWNLTTDIKRSIFQGIVRHTYSTMLIANGEHIKVVQELMRHTNSHRSFQVLKHVSPSLLKYGILQAACYWQTHSA